MKEGCQFYLNLFSGNVSPVNVTMVPTILSFITEAFRSVNQLILNLHCLENYYKTCKTCNTDRWKVSLQNASLSFSSLSDHESSDDNPSQSLRRRRTSSSCSVGPGALDTNRSALLDISAGSVRLFNLEHRCVLWEKAVRHVSSILSVSLLL